MSIKREKWSSWFLVINAAFWRNLSSLLHYSHCDERTRLFVPWREMKSRLRDKTWLCEFSDFCRDDQKQRERPGSCSSLSEELSEQTHLHTFTSATTEILAEQKKDTFSRGGPTLSENTWTITLQLRFNTLSNILYSQHGGRATQETLRVGMKNTWKSKC